MPQRSAGIVLFRRTPAFEILLVHPGGPFWRNKDEAAWSIPKGFYSPDEEPLAAARREFREETGVDIDGDFIDLGVFRQPGGKIVSAFAVEGDFDLERFMSNMFSMEWPPKSGRLQQFPEADRAGWFAPPVARRKLHKGQVAIVTALLDKLGVSDAA
jgi:predicted NUDIX family NTP pyrophosphohydrolase